MKNSDETQSYFWWGLQKIASMYIEKRRCVILLNEISDYRTLDHFTKLLVRLRLVCFKYYNPLKCKSSSINNNRLTAFVNIPELNYVYRVYVDCCFPDRGSHNDLFGK